MTNVNTPITSLPVATALTGAELVPIVQGGTTKQTTVEDVGGFLGGSPSFVAPFLGVATATSINGVTIDSSEYTAYTPTVTSGTGALGTLTSTGRYKQIGKTVFVYARTDITNNGTGASWIDMTLPSSVLSPYSYILPGMESTTSTTVTGICGGNTVSVLKYDGSYPAGAGTIIIVSGFYESAV